jgi:hypothetical protein
LNMHQSVFKNSFFDDADAVGERKCCDHRSLQIGRKSRIGSGLILVARGVEVAFKVTP